MRKRADFLKARAGARSARGVICLEACWRADDLPCRIGFTATRKLGNAVIRNRAKRRMREAAKAVLVPQARRGVDYVLIARSGIAESNWARLLDDVSAALVKLHAALGAQQANAARATPEHSAPMDPPPLPAPDTPHAKG